jgi:hypothetical protein
MMRFKATGYTEYCPVYEPPLPPKEPDYSRFKFRSRLKPRPAKPDACECQVAALEAIRQLLTAPLISSPLVSSEATFEAPYPCMSEPRDRLPETIRITQEQYELAKVRWNSHHEQFKVDKKTEDWIFGKLRSLECSKAGSNPMHCRHRTEQCKRSMARHLRPSCLF